MIYKRLLRKIRLSKMNLIKKKQGTNSGAPKASAISASQVAHIQCKLSFLGKTKSLLEKYWRK
jgi:hypothetical protein